MKTRCSIMTNNFRDFLLFSAGGLLALLSYVVYDNFNSKKKRLSNWKTGENQPIPYKPEWYCFDPKVLQSKNTYKLLISSIIPRPIALVSSMDSNGVLNCAPYSYFNTVGHDPPLIVLGCCINGRTKSKKDTLKNIEETKQFVVNIVSSWYIDSANHTCGEFPSEINEMELAGLTNVPSVVVKPPRVGEAAIQLECELFELRPVFNDSGAHSVTIVIGRIVRFHINKQVLKPNSAEEGSPEVDWSKLLPVGRLGGDSYTFVKNEFELPRPARTIQ